MGSRDDQFAFGGDYDSGMVFGWFSFSFSMTEHAQWVLSKFWHIEMAPILLKTWSPLFDPDREQRGEGPISVRVPGLPLQFWSKDVFKSIGDDLGTFLYYENSFSERGKTVFVRILVHPDTRKGLFESLLLQWRGYSRLQKLDYKGVPFRCRRCYEVGHLCNECPLLAKEKEEIM